MGGFLGVDVFFVLSGYLVTQLLVRDLRERGSVDFARFYSRRIRRLLPAASVVLVVTMVVFSSVGSPVEQVDAGDATRAAALYVSNWYFIDQATDYFGADIKDSPVAHFWSLSVEEQFYIVWPLLLAGLYLATRRMGQHRWRVVQGAVLAGALASLASAFWVAETDVNRAYFGTDTRAYQLLAGALLALAPGGLARLRASRWSPWLPFVTASAFAALLLLCTDLVDANPVERGAAATIATIALLASLEANPIGPVRWVLTLPPIVYLGRISYGTYLWHWIVVLVIERVVDASPLPTVLIVSLIASGLAALSFELLERPVREVRSLDRRGARVIGVGLATSAIIALVAAPRILRFDEGGPATVAQGTAVGLTRVPDDLDWRGAEADKAVLPECTSADPDGCIVVEGTGPRVLLIGDSHARMYVPALTALAEEQGLSLSVAVVPACPWQDGLQYRIGGGRCQAAQADRYPTIVEALDPDLVLLANRSLDDPAYELPMLADGATRVDATSADGLEVIEAKTAATLKRLSVPGRNLVIIEPVPTPRAGDDPLACLSEATFLDECRFVANAEPTAVELMYRRLADADEGVWTLDLDQAVCPYLPICDPIVGNRIVRSQGDHLTSRFAATLADPFGRFLADNGLLGPPRRTAPR